MPLKIISEKDDSLPLSLVEPVVPSLFLMLRNSEFFKYFAVSVVALICDFIAFSVSLRGFEFSWSMAATLGFVVGVTVAYVLSVRFVFLNRNLHKSPVAELLAFSLVGLCGLVVTQLVMWTGIEWLKFNPEVSKLCAAAFTFLFNFVLRKIILFSANSNLIYNKSHRNETQ